MRKLLIALQLLLPVLVLAAFAASAVAPPSLERALDAQRKLLQRQPTAERWNDLGNLLQLGGRSSDAREAYEQALTLDPKLASAHYNLGLLLRQAGEERQALAHFREVVELEPRNAWGWYQLGALHEAHHSESAAVRAYARAFALDPRLSFHDVNPQLIDNKLTTQALLAAQQELPETADAPRAYEDPRHIAKLLLPQAPAATASATPEPAPAPTPALPEGGRVLRPQDLRPGSRAGGLTGSAPPNTGRSSMPAPGAEGSSYSELLRQQLELQQQQEQQQDQMQMEESGEGAPAGVYVPGVRSSAQLRQRLDPAPAG